MEENFIRKKEIVKTVLGVQEDRAKIYHEFTAEFKQFLKEKDEEQYNETVKNITTQMSQKSMKIREIIDELKASNSFLDLLENLETLQNFEKQLLTITVSMQVMRKEMVIDKNDEFEVTDPVYIQSLKQKMQQLQVIITTINELIYNLRYDLEEEE